MEEIQLNMIIYKTENKINGKIYIGQDSRNRGSYLGSGLLLKRAINYYGKENFEKTILENCPSKEVMGEREKYWISYYKEQGYTLYNLAPGGTGGYTGTPWNKGKSLSEEHRQKLIESHKEKPSSALGYRWTDEQREKISKQRKGRTPWNKGKKLPKLSEDRKGSGNPQYGKPAWNSGKKLSEDHKKKLRLAKKAKRDSKNVNSTKGK